MKTYIEDVNGNKYYFARLSFQDTLKYQKLLSKQNEDNILTMLEIVKQCFAKKNTDYDISKFDSEIVDYNFSEIGLERFVILIQAIIEEVFQQKGTNPEKYSFLEEKVKELEQVKEKILKEQTETTEPTEQE